MMKEAKVLKGSMGRDNILSSVKRMQIYQDWQIKREEKETGVYEEDEEGREEGWWVGAWAQYSRAHCFLVQKDKS